MSVTTATPFSGPLIAAPKCPLCGCKGTHAYADVPDLVCGTPGAWSYLRCESRACSTLWLSPRPADLSPYYANYITHEVGADAGAPSGLKALFFAWTRHAARAALFVGPAPSKGLRLLEVGCGNGTNLRTLARLGWTVYGQDIDPTGIAKARSLGFAPADRFVTGPLEGNAFPEPFDVVLGVHVFEHVEDPRGFLHSCAALVKPGGRLVLITPNARGLGFFFFGRLWAALHAPYHLFLVTPETLHTIAQKAGLVVESATSESSFAGHEAAVSLHARFGPAAVRWCKIPALVLLLIGRALFPSRGEEAILLARKAEDRA